MVESEVHPLVADEPGGLCWKRSDRRRPGRGPESHRELVVLHALSGRAEYLMDGAVHQLERGSLLWAFAGQAHVLLSDTPEFDMWVFLISERVLPPNESPSLPTVRLIAGASVSPRRLDDGTTRALADIAENVRNELCPHARRIGLRWWLLRAWSFWKGAADAKARQVHPAVERAVRILRTDPMISVSDLAQESGLSQSRLARVFKDEIGCKITKFRTDQKLDRVDSLMRSKRMTLTTAALDAGFGSYSQFYRAFEVRRGAAPGQFYRRT